MKLLMYNSLIMLLLLLLLLLFTRYIFWALPKGGLIGGLEGWPLGRRQAGRGRRLAARWQSRQVPGLLARSLAPGTLMPGN